MSRRSARRRRFRPTHALTLLGVLMILGAAGAWLLMSVASTERHLDATVTSSRTLEAAIIAGNKPAAAQALAALQNSAAGAESSSSGPLWTIGSFLPFIGADLGAVQSVSDVIDDVARRALPSLLKITTQLDLNTFSPHDGKVDVKSFSTLAEPVSRANAVLRFNKFEIDKIDVDKLNPRVRDAVADLQTKVGAASRSISIINNVVDLAPTMLGGKDRTYLLVFQNNAEIRSTGGIPGAYLLAKVDKGTIKLGEQGSGAEFGKMPAVTKLTAEEKDLYTRRMAQYFLDSNFTPEFARTAQIMSGLIKAKQGVKVDGVFSVDPVTMSYVLAGTGPVTVPDGTVINTKNVIDELLNKSYLRYADDFLAQDQFFEDTAAELFDVFIEGTGDTDLVARGLVRAGRENRIYAWSAHADEQRQLEAMSVAGSIDPDSLAKPSLGIYLNDSVGAKLQYYLGYSTQVESLACGKLGRQTMRATVTFTSSVPKRADKLPFAILGYSQEKEPGRMRMNLRFYLPTGGELVTSRIGKTLLGSTTRQHNSHEVVTIPIRLDPGQRSTATVDFTTGFEQAQQIEVRTTPSAQPGRHVRVGPSACS